MKRTNVKKLLSVCLILVCLLSCGPVAFAGKPSEQDLRDMQSGIEYPKANEYLEHYIYATINAPKGHSVYCYGSADRAGSQYTVLHGENVTIIAQRKNMSCIIIPSQNRARWVKTEYLKYDEQESSSVNSSISSGPSSTGTAKVCDAILVSSFIELLNDQEDSCEKSGFNRAFFAITALTDAYLQDQLTEDQYTVYLNNLDDAFFAFTEYGSVATFEIVAFNDDLSSTIFISYMTGTDMLTLTVNHSQNTREAVRRLFKNLDWEYWELDDDEVSDAFDSFIEVMASVADGITDSIK